MSHHVTCSHSIFVLQMGLKGCSYKRRVDRIALRAGMYFTHFLSQRNYDGKLRFNHENGTLEMQVHEHMHKRQQRTVMHV